LAPLVDLDHRNDDLLEGGAAMDEAAAGAFAAEAVDRLRDENLNVPLKPNLLGGKLPQTRRLLEAVAQDEATVPKQDAVPSDLGSGEVTLLDGAVLVNESVVGGHNEVAGVGGRQ